MTQRLEILRRFELFRGRLSAREAQEIEEQIKISPELQRDYEVDRGLFRELDRLAQTEYRAPGNFSHGVTHAIRQRQELYDQKFSLGRVLRYSAGWVAVAASAVIMLAQLSDMPPGYFEVATSSGVKTLYNDKRLALYPDWLILARDPINIAIAVFLTSYAGIMALFLRRRKVGAFLLILALGIFLSGLYISASPEELYFYRDQPLRRGSRYYNG